MTLADWDEAIPAFSSFPNGTTAFVDRPEIDVFAFTQENINNSMVGLWYAAWIREAQHHPQWEELGETGYFSFVFFQTKDYFCDISVQSCTKEVSEDYILKRWPGDENKALAQRIYLVACMKQQTHATKHAKLVCELHIIPAMKQDSQAVIGWLSKRL